jgi:hypothetical protein
MARHRLAIPQSRSSGPERLAQTAWRSMSRTPRAGFIFR